MNYKKIYDNIIKKRQHQKVVGYSEKHHILPRCLGGTEDLDNIVSLTAREHFIAHLLLIKIYDNNPKLIYAFNMMFRVSEDQDRYMPPSHWYEYRRKMFSKYHPMKNEDIKQRCKDGMRRYAIESNLGKTCEFTICKHCNNITYSNSIYCSEKCKRDRVQHLRKIREEKFLQENGKPCLYCDKLHLKTYCCSQECFEKYIKLPDNLYSKKLSESRSNHIRVSGIGNNMAKTSTIEIYNNNDELMFVSSRDNGGIINLCKEHELPYRAFQGSYLSGKRIGEGMRQGWINKMPTDVKKYLGWYSIKIN